MYQRIVKHLAARTAAVLMLAGGGVLLTAGNAAAAAATATSSSAQVSYSCDLSGFGQDMGTLPVNATLSAPSTVSGGTAMTVTLVTSAAQIPAATASQLPQISSLGLSGASRLTGVSGSGAGLTRQASLTGQSSRLTAGAGQMSEFPSMTATGTVTPRAAGGWTLAAPQSFQLQAKGATQMAPVTCTLVKTVTVQVTVTPASTATSGSAGTTGTSGTSGAQMYTCTVTQDTTTMGSSQIPLRLAHAGQGVVGMPESVSLSSAAGAMNHSSAFSGSQSSGAQFSGSQWASSGPMASSASLGLSGASAGSVPLSWSPSRAGSGQFALTGRWTPKTAGTFRLQAPRQFTVKMRQQQATMVTVTVVCTAMTATTQTATVTVATAPVAQAQATGMPTGSAAAPNTGAGGSLHPATDIALAVAGGVVLLGGAGLMTLALRRRGRSAA